MPVSARSFTLAVVLGAACKMGPEGSGGGRAGPAPPAAHLEFVHAREGEVAPLVKAAAEKAEKEGRRFVVYEGASWCEPCQRFHAAAAKGELDAMLPKLTFLEFDADQDGARLRQAGYGSQYIPLFALARPDGRAAGPMAQGGIKGDGAEKYVADKLKKLLDEGR